MLINWVYKIQEQELIWISKVNKLEITKDPPNATLTDEKQKLIKQQYESSAKSLAKQNDINLVKLEVGKDCSAMLQSRVVNQM